MKNYFKRNWVKLVIIVCLLAVDMLTKFLLDGKVITLIPNVLSLTSSHNTGASFSMLSDKTLLLTIISAVFLLVFIGFDLYVKIDSKLYKIASALIIVGALGNFIDRVIFGYVRDFIYLEFINFAIFNVADMCLCIGVALIVIYIIFFTKGEKKQN